MRCLVSRPENCYCLLDNKRGEGRGRYDDVVHPRRKGVEGGGKRRAVHRWLERKTGILIRCTPRRRLIPYCRTWLSKKEKKSKQLEETRMGLYSTISLNKNMTIHLPAPALTKERIDRRWRDEKKTLGLEKKNNSVHSLLRREKRRSRSGPRDLSRRREEE